MADTIAAGEGGKKPVPPIVPNLPLPMLPTNLLSPTISAPQSFGNQERSDMAQPYQPYLRAQGLAAILNPLLNPFAVHVPNLSGGDQFTVGQALTSAPTAPEALTNAIAGPDARKQALAASAFSQVLGLAQPAGPLESQSARVLTAPIGKNLAETAKNVASDVAEKAPSAAANEALATARGDAFAPNTGGALKPGSSASEVAATRTGLGGTGGQSPQMPDGPTFSGSAYPAQSQGLLGRLQQQGAEAINANRPTIPFEQQKANAEAITDPIWKVADDLNRNMKPGELTAKVQHINDEVSNLLVSSEQLRVKISNGTATPEDRLAYALQLKSAFVGRAAAVGATSEAARTVGAQGRVPVGTEVSRTAGIINDIIDRAVTSHPEKIDEIANAVSAIGNEPKKLIAMARELGTKPTAWDKFYEFYRSNVLWNVGTHIVNTSSGLAQVALLGARTTIQPVAEVAQALYTLGRYQRQAFFSDIPTFWRSLAKGYGGMFENLPEQIAKSELADRMESRLPYGAIGGVAGDVVRAPFKFLTAADMFQTKPAYNAMLNVYAQREGLKLGLSGRVLQDFVDNLSPAAKAEIGQRAEATAQEFALHGKGEFASALVNLRNASPAMALQILFINTPINLAKMGIRFSPLGATRIPVALAKGEFNRIPEITTESAIIGGGITAGFLALLNTDNMTGLSPKSTAEKQLWEAEGRGPMMIRATEYPILGPLFRQVYGDRADKTWVTVNWLGPMIYPALVASAAKESVDSGGNITPEHVAYAAGAVGNTIVNTIPLYSSYQGVTNLLQNPSVDSATRYLANLAKPLIPFESGLAMVERMTDAFKRKPETLAQVIQSLFPGVAQDVHPALDVLGRPIEQPTGPQAALPRAQFENPSPTLAEDRRLRDANPNFVGLTKPSDTVGTGDKKIQLTSDQYFRYQQLAGQAKDEAIQKLLMDPGYQRASIADQSKKFEQTESTAQQGALRMMGIELASNSQDLPTILTGARLATANGDNYQKGKALQSIGRNLTPEVQQQLDALRANPDKAKAIADGKSYDPSVKELLHGAELTDAYLKSPEFIFGDKATWDRAAKAAVLLEKMRSQDQALGKNPEYDPDITKFYYSIPGLSTFYTKAGTAKDEYVSSQRKIIAKDFIWRYFSAAAQKVEDQQRQ